MASPLTRRRPTTLTCIPQKPSNDVGCITVDVQGFKIVFADDLQNPTPLDAYEDDMSLLVHELDEARTVASWRASRTDFANVVGLDPDVLILGQDAVECITQIVCFSRAFFRRLPFDLNRAASGRFVCNAR